MSNTSGEYTDAEIQSEVKRFEALRLAFTVLQIPEAIINGILKVLSAILWLGNLDFSDIDGERCELTESDKEIIKIVAELLGIHENELIQVALKRQINVRGNITEIPLKVQEARENRNAVNKINIFWFQAVCSNNHYTRFCTDGQSIILTNICMVNQSHKHMHQSG